jgi:hypothetical protein
MSTENPTPVTSLDDPNRPLQMHEVRSLVDELRHANVHVYTKQAWRRDRTIGWLLTFALLAGMAWIIWDNYATTQHLKQSIYQACLVSNERVTAERTLFNSVAGQVKDPSFRGMLISTSSRLSPTDCAARYLND